MSVKKFMKILMVPLCKSQNLALTEFKVVWRDYRPFIVSVLACSSIKFDRMATQYSGQWIASMAKVYGEQFILLDTSNSLCLFWNHSSISTG